MRINRNGSDIPAGSLDGPNAVAPMLHVFGQQRCAWLEIADDLPRYDRPPPHATDRDPDPAGDSGASHRRP